MDIRDAHFGSAPASQCFGLRYSADRWFHFCKEQFHRLRTRTWNETAASMESASQSPGKQRRAAALQSATPFGHGAKGPIPTTSQDIIKNVVHDFYGSTWMMKMLEGRVPRGRRGGQELSASRNSSLENRVFMKVPHDHSSSPRSMKMLEGPAPSEARSRQSATLHQNRIFIKDIPQGGISILIGLMTFLVFLQPAIASMGAGAVVLVNSQAMDFSEFRQNLEPYLIQFGVPYTVQDISQKPLGTDLQDYALVIIGHRGFDLPRRFLNAEGEHQLLTAIRHGTGLVSYDGLLVAWQNDKPQQPYRFMEEIFDFDYQPPAATESITIGSATEQAGTGASAHFITSGRSTPREIKLKASLKIPGLRVRKRGEVLASAGDHPILVSASYGEGNVVLFSTIEWSRPDVKGRIYGLDDLIWRSLVWAARKPFILRGMPRFLAFRVDDVSGFGKESNQHLGWIAPVNKYGLKPWLGLFIDDLKEDPEALKQLSRLTQQGLATASIHARRWKDFFYLEEPLWTDLLGRNAAGRPWPDEKIESNFAEGEAFFTRYGIAKSKVVIPHFCEFSLNDFKGLANWGCEFVGVLLQPGHGWGMSTVSAGPYLPNEPAKPTNSLDPVYIADWLTVPGHPEYEHRFFNFVVEMHDIAGYEWAPSGVPVEEAIRRGVEETRREWDSLLPGVLFTHESDHIQHLSPQDWDHILKGVVDGLQDYHPIPVTLDYLSQYLRALNTSKISSARAEPGTNEILLEFEGSADLPTRFWVFNLDRGRITGQELEVEAFQGKTRFKRPVSSQSGSDSAAVVQ